MPAIQSLNKLPAGSHDGHLSKEPVQDGHLQVTWDRGEGDDVDTSAAHPTFWEYTKLLTGLQGEHMYKSTSKCLLHVLGVRQMLQLYLHIVAIEGRGCVHWRCDTVIRWWFFLHACDKDVVQKNMYKGDIKHTNTYKCIPTHSHAHIICTPAHTCKRWQHMHQWFKHSWWLVACLSLVQKQAEISYKEGRSP